MAASQNTININGAQGASSSSWNGLSGLNATTVTLDDWLQPAKPGFKKYEIIECEKDLLALSVARHRLGNHYATLLDSELLKQVTQSDHDQAQVIRDHYQKKFVIWALQGIELSPFRTDLKEFVHTDGLRFKETMVPLAWKLPEFYLYDIEFEKIHHEFNTTVTNQKEDCIETTRTLNLVKTFDVNNRARKKREYWFHDQYNNLVYLAIDRSNMLLGLMDFMSNATLTVKAQYIKRNRDGREFLKLRNMSFL